jgi:type III restriction enzyme
MATANAADLTMTPGKSMLGTPADVWLRDYDEFLSALCTDENGSLREFQIEAIKATMRFLAPGHYASVDKLVAETWADPDNSTLTGYYGSEEAHRALCSFPGKLAASLDLATAAGKSYVIYGIVRIAMNEGWFQRVVVLCPSLTIEAGLRDKFGKLQTRTDLTKALPDRTKGIRVPNLLDDAHTTIGPGDVCVENVHATYQATGSSLRDSFSSQTGSDTLVINDEAHHVYNIDKGMNNQKKVSDPDGTRWHQFCASDEYAFGAVLGLSGTCYHPRKDQSYFADVIYRYPIRDAIADRHAKEVDYVTDAIGDFSPSVDAQLEALWKAHNTAKELLATSGSPIKPLALVVTALQKDADKLADRLIKWAKRHKNTDIADKVIVVTSAKDHEEGRRRLATVDDPSSTVEFIISVSMLTEGWDAKNVFTILPAEERAFNSRLLIAQVLGRGLRIPIGTPPAGGWKVIVLNHREWGDEVQQLVDDVLERSITVSVAPVEGQGVVSHLLLDRLDITETTTTTNEPATVLQPDPDLLVHGTVALLPQDETRRQELILADPLHRRATGRIDVSEQVANTWLSIVAAAERIRTALRAEHRSDAVMTRILRENLTTTALTDLINRSLSAVGCAGQIHLSPANLALVEDCCRTKMFPPQGSLFEERIVVVKHEQIAQVSTRELRPSTRRVSQLASREGHDVFVCFSVASRQLHAQNRTGEEANLAQALQEGIFKPTILADNNYKSPTNMVVVSYRPEVSFVRDVLTVPTVASLLSGWVKSPDSGFWSIPYEVLSGIDEGDLRQFNPDFLLADPRTLLEGGTGHVYVVETKADDEADSITTAKIAAAQQYVARLNELLDENGYAERPRYSFHLMSPNDYADFKSRVQQGTAHDFVGKVHLRLRPGVAESLSGETS